MSGEQTRIITFESVMAYLKSHQRNNADKGELWEKVTAWYLRNDPASRQYLGTVWRWGDAANPKYDGHDHGIDLVAEDLEHQGKYWAIQCKNYDPSHKLDYGDVATTYGTALADPEYVGIVIVSASDGTTKTLDDQAYTARVKRGITTAFVTPTTMAQSNVDWANLMTGVTSERHYFELRDDQQEAVDCINKAWESNDRCKAIMACGTGKTLMSLRLVEGRCPHGTVLFAAPSIALVTQALRAWANQARVDMRALVVCSDGKASKVTDDAILDDVVDAGFPASTNPSDLVARYRWLRSTYEGSMVVVFSTYQSMQVVQDAQSLGLPPFDVAVCDEAHRTTGIRYSGMTDEDVSAFQIVNDGKRIRATKRLYMTATPKIYKQGAQVKAREMDAELSSMDDESIYGPQAYRLSFATAVDKGLLVDYRVIVLAISEDIATPEMMARIPNTGHELQVSDAAKIIGTYKGIARHGVAAQTRLNTYEGDEAGDMPDFVLIDDLTDENGTQGDEPTAEQVEPLHCAVGFCNTIAASKAIDDYFTQVVDDYVEETGDDQGVHCDLRHVDGGMDSKERGAALDWLAGGRDEDECRILTNARCLSEGVDVPNLDAVIFFAAKRSEVDVVQAVGRVMRTFTDERTGEEKKLGYIILPVVIPSGVTAEEALSGDDSPFDVVWKVLAALRSHDDRMNAYVNSLPMRHVKPKGKLKHGGAGTGGSDVIGQTTDDEQTGKGQGSLVFDFGSTELERAVYAKAVDKCGTKIYWDTWAEDVAKIAQRHIEQIDHALETDESAADAFGTFLESLRASLNPSITKDDAVKMVAQHMITLPVFDALFGDEAFAASNPVSVAISQFLDALQGRGVGEMDADDKVELGRLYDSVRMRASFCRTDSNRQRLIKDLYNDFFSKAFSKDSEKLGIVYTPIEIVDFMLHFADRTMRREFGRGISDPGVHVLDPFAGTGSYIGELIGDETLIPDDRLKDKYLHELHSNEIVLLAYYIMVVNIEYAAHSRHVFEGDEYLAFPGAVLTDTFQQDEDSDELDLGLLVDNSERILEQQEAPIFLCIGNPPYNSGQNKASDDNAREHYPRLEQRVRETYSARSDSTNKNSIMDSYIEAFRWASDRIGKEGMVCFVSNAGWLRSDSGKGIRACFANEFSDIYVFDLLGNQRTQGEESKRQGGKVFGSGSRAPIAITTLIKNPKAGHSGKIHYHCVGEYKTRQEKLQAVKESIDLDPAWETLTPDKYGDWLDQRDDSFYELAPLGVFDGKKKTSLGLFHNVWSRGIATAKDAWAWNYSSARVTENMSRLVANMNEEIAKANGNTKAVTYDAKRFTWNRETLRNVRDKKPFAFHANCVVRGTYRPFCKQYVYWDESLLDMVYQQQRLFPLINRNQTAENIVIALSIGTKASCLVTDMLPDLHFVGDAQCFPLYWYEEDKGSRLLPAEGEKVIRASDGTRYVRHDAITDETLAVFRATYPTAFLNRPLREGPKEITKSDIFWYIYGVLHSPEYHDRYARNLAKELPRIPLVRDFDVYSRVGRSLGELHLGYESVEPWVGLSRRGDLPGLDPGDLVKLRWGKRRDPETGKSEDDHTRLVYNGNVTIENIPEQANLYKINGRSPLEWAIDRYQMSTDKASGIINDPNEASDDPRYVLDLVCRLVTVSMRTLESVAQLPPLREVSRSKNWPAIWSQKMDQ